MTTMAMGLGLTLEATCRMEDLLRAIRVVVPHVGKEKDGGGVERIRVVMDTELMRLALLATCEMSSVVVLLPLLEADEVLDADGRPVVEADLDLTAPAAKVFPAVFERTNAETARLEVDLGRRTLQVTDISGLLEGRTVRVHASSEWTGDEGERVCAAQAVMAVCQQPVAASGSVMLPATTLRSWAASARAMGALPLRVTTQGHALVAAGALEDLAGLTVLGQTMIMGAGDAPLGAPAYDGPGVAALMGLLLDGEPAGGEPARDREHSLVTEISSWLREQPSHANSAPSASSADGADDVDGPQGGDAA